MKIQEAIKSGKPFKRRRSKFWIEVYQNSFVKEMLPQTGTLNTFYVTMQFRFGKKKQEKPKWEEAKLTYHVQPVYLLPSSILAKDWIVKKTMKGAGQ